MGIPKGYASSDVSKSMNKVEGYLSIHFVHFSEVLHIQEQEMDENFDFIEQVHVRTHKCWSVSCNCGVVVKEGQDVISVNYCGNRHNPFVGFLSKKEPLHGTGIQKSGNTYRVRKFLGDVKYQS